MPRDYLVRFQKKLIELEDAAVISKTQSDYHIISSVTEQVKQATKGMDSEFKQQLKIQMHARQVTRFNSWPEYLEFVTSVQRAVQSSVQPAVLVSRRCSRRCSRGVMEGGCCWRGLWRRGLRRRPRRRPRRWRESLRPGDTGALRPERRQGRQRGAPLSFGVDKVAGVGGRVRRMHHEPGARAVRGRARERESRAK